jgi:hypothetical protein
MPLTELIRELLASAERPRSPPTCARLWLQVCAHRGSRRNKQSGQSRRDGSCETSIRMKHRGPPLSALRQPLSCERATRNFGAANTTSYGPAGLTPDGNRRHYSNRRRSQRRLNLIAQFSTHQTKEGLHEYRLEPANSDARLLGSDYSVSALNRCVRYCESMAAISVRRNIPSASLSQLCHTCTRSSISAVVRASRIHPLFFGSSIASNAQRPELGRQPCLSKVTV